MTNPNLAKGAIPLDAAAKKVFAANDRANSATAPANGEAATQETSTQEASKEIPADSPTVQMCLMLSTIYNETRAGRVKSMAVVFLDDSGVPQVGYHVAPQAAVPMLGGMMIATDALKDGARSSMDGYRAFLHKKAQHDAQRQPATLTDREADGEAGTQKAEPGEGEQSKH